MSNYILTPEMNLPNPIPGVDPGPDYANNISACFTILDGHNHSPGSGNQINPSGILINADLPFNSAYNATLLRSVRFTTQTLPLGGAQDLGCLYVSGVDLYFNDENGNQVQITSGGTVNATSSGISSGTATASFVGGVLVVNSNTNTPANIQAGSILIGNNTPSPNFVTLAPPNALAASYTLTQPAALPANTALLLTSSSGTESYLTGTVTQTLRGGSTPVFTSPNVAVSSSCGSYTQGSAGNYAITNLTVSITTSGRPVLFVMQSDGSGNPASVVAPGLGSNIYWGRFAVEIGRMALTNTTNSFCVSTIDTPGAGTYTYQAYVHVLGTPVSINNFVIAVYEM